MKGCLYHKTKGSPSYIFMLHPMITDFTVLNADEPGIIYRSTAATGQLAIRKYLRT
jgi:hypothetical protein